ncbi:metal dependent phosphohydrolase [Desulfurobacterium thermolithotrophum DSM 11699]|uniref:Metal dependent phosphohydrolase n=1 Tax=Desulfurobacterium thermolithotrophum (strain DSM 11699 / BSA) TaxID=868864 RepID=F0S252_DESTD|nr:HD domain-containing phosphohydrolase [Desulfurobacterium thermolithotrophum]ADY72995.1 metal dependent phosphohydrolase [Desulfurobacterium thermolithotrophum DSM 11699]
MLEPTLDISKLLLAVSSLNSLANPILNNHNYKVAFISYLIAREISYSSEFLYNILVAGLFHDIGLLMVHSKDDIASVSNLELEEEQRLHIHSEVGYQLLKKFPYFSKIAKIVKYHHYPYKESFRKEVPYSSSIIYLADRIDVFIASKIKNENPYSKISLFLPQLEDYLLRYKGKKLDPKLVDLFLKKICPKEAFWYEILNRSCLEETLEKLLKNFENRLPTEAFYDFTQLLAYLIDFKSPFTATHSSGVAQTALALANLFNFTYPDLMKMHIAGLLHDIGKIAIPSTILEKPDRLTEEEYNVMKSHVFFSYKIISKLEVEKDIVEWASYHHETLDGSGYPFKLREEDLSLGSRIMAVADIFTALMEDRPYKKGLPIKKAMAIIDMLANKNKLDKNVVYVLKKILRK